MRMEVGGIPVRFEGELSGDWSGISVATLFSFPQIFLFPSSPINKTTLAKVAALSGAWEGGGGVLSRKRGNGVVGEAGGGVLS